jgi:hypothetical protein
MNITRFAFYILLAASFYWTGCEMFASHTNPIAGWQSSSLTNFGSNKAISDDFQTYINRLPPKLRNGVGPMQFYQDGTGQHAVMVEIALNGTDWAHVLIYDKDNKRVKVYKYVAGHYQS